jgi:hypothetical protein
MKHVIALVVGIAVIFAGILVYALWGHFIIGGFGPRYPIDSISIVSILIVLFGFVILYWFCIQKVGIRTWFGRIIIILYAHFWSDYNRYLK